MSARGIAAAAGLGVTPLWGGLSLLALGFAGAWREALWVAFPEELLFRGAIQGELRRRFSAARAIVVAAALFALAHVATGGGASALLTFVPGVAFGLLRSGSRSVWPAVAAHAVANVLWLRG